MNIFRQELRMYFWPLIGWLGLYVALALMFVSIFPMFTQDIAASKKLLEGFPPQMQAALGISITSFFSFSGFLGYMLTYFGLAGAVQAMNLGINMLGRETISGTSDFLLTRPMRRSRIFEWKLAAVVYVLLVTNLVVFVAIAAMVRVFGITLGDMLVYTMLAAAFFVLQLVFVALGILISQLIGRIRAPLVVSLSVCAGLFAIGLLGSISGDKLIRAITPFKYFDYTRIVATRSYEMTYVVLALVVVVVATGSAAVIFTRHDARSIS